MYVPVAVPAYGHHTTVVKNIIYQDTVLNLKDKGANLCVTTIEVNAYQLESCLNTIFESNPDVSFNIVQYSPKNEEVTFYTDKKISTEKWDKRYDKTYSYVNSVSLVEQIRHVLNSQDSLDEYIISVFDVWRVCHRLYVKEHTFRKIIEEKIERKIKSEKDYYYICSHGYSFFNEEYHLSIHTTDWVDVYFKKKNGDIYVDRTEGKERLFSINILSLIGQEVDEIFDYYETKRDRLCEQRIDSVQSVNAKFYCSCNRVEVVICNNEWLHLREFRVKASLGDKKFECESNSSNVHEVIRGRENEFAKKIFIKISDCPQWMQEELIQLRREQVEQLKIELAEKERLARKEAKKLARKQKRRNFWKNIFPWLE